MIEHRIGTADGLSLHVVEHGPKDGIPVLLIHGWPDTHEVWRHQIVALAENGFRTIAHDQRGFGQSDRPVELAGYHVFKAMGDVSSVLDGLQIERVHLVGHDWGSAPCWLAATFLSERVRSLTSLSVGHPTAFREAGMDQRQKSFYMLLFQFVGIAEQWLSNDDWANMKTLIGDLENWPRRQRALEIPGALTASLNWYRANMGPETLIETPRDLPKVTVPSLGVMGADDWALLDGQMIASKDCVDAVFEYVNIPDAAHWLQTDQPEVVNDVLIEWMAAHG